MTLVIEVELGRKRAKIRELNRNAHEVRNSDENTSLKGKKGFVACFHSIGNPHL